MEEQNYGTRPGYEKNQDNRAATNITAIDKTQNKDTTKTTIEAIITEQIIIKGITQLNVYHKYEGSDKYVPVDSYSIQTDQENQDSAEKTDKPNTNPLKSYEDIRIEDILDVSRFFPIKHLFIEQMPDNILGYTAIGSPNIFRNSRLIPGSERAYEVDVHEKIHTNDEFETRILTSWILDTENKGSDRYQFKSSNLFYLKREK